MTISEVATRLPVITKSAPIFPENKSGYFMSPLASLEMRSLLRQVDKKVSMVELGIEFGACDPRTNLGREALRLALRSNKKREITTRFEFDQLAPAIISGNLAAPQIAVPDSRTLEMRAVIHHNLARQRGQQQEVGAPSRDYVLVGPLVTASVCEVARQYLEQTERPNGFAVSVIEDVLETYDTIN